MKKIVLSSIFAVTLVMAGVCLVAAQENAERAGSGINVGGNLKIYTYDQTQGERNGAKQNNNISSGFHELIIYLSKELNDWLNIETQTMVTASASATPTVGSNISRTTTAATAASISQAFMGARLPYETEMRVGMMEAMFSEEYGKETWWEELYHQDYALVRLQSWPDNGIELYRNFETGAVNIPVYLYSLNGSAGSARNVDNNEGKTVLIHAAPEFFQGSLRFPISVSQGKYDAANMYDLARHSGGIDWKYKKIGLSGEYLYNKYQGVTTSAGGADGINQGYFAKAVYTFNPRWKTILKYVHAELYKASATTLMEKDTYNDTIVSLDYSLTPSSIVMAQFANIDGKRSDDSETLKALRFTLGWRTTF